MNIPCCNSLKLLSEEIFTPGLPSVLMLPPAGEDATNKEVGYLLEKLQTLGRWPILVPNVSYKMKRYVFTEIHPHGSYIILISVPCKEWAVQVLRFGMQLYELSLVTTQCTRGINKQNSLSQ